jgi:hypothetical protein
VAAASCATACSRRDHRRRCVLEADAYRALVVALTRLSPAVDAAQLQRLRAFADELVATS